MVFYLAVFVLVLASYLFIIGGLLRRLKDLERQNAELWIKMQIMDASKSGDLTTAGLARQIYRDPRWDEDFETTESPTSAGAPSTDNDNVDVTFTQEG
jgi:hypothetical protein